VTAKGSEGVGATGQAPGLARELSSLVLDSWLPGWGYEPGGSVTAKGSEGVGATGQAPVLARELSSLVLDSWMPG